MRALRPIAGGVALDVAQGAARVLVSNGLSAGERARLLAAAGEGPYARLAEYLAAHPEVRARARKLRR